MVTNCCQFLSDDLDAATVALVRQLQHEHLTEAEVDSIMEETFEARKAWILNRLPRIRVVFAKFPPLKDVLSDHVRRDLSNQSVLLILITILFNIIITDYY